jgi:hypothetical protein
MAQEVKEKFFFPDHFQEPNWHPANKSKMTLLRVKYFSHTTHLFLDLERLK